MTMILNTLMILVVLIIVTVVMMVIIVKTCLKISSLSLILEMPEEGTFDSSKLFLSWIVSFHDCFKEFEK